MVSKYFVSYFNLAGNVMRIRHVKHPAEGVPFYGEHKG